ncbi:hypothetical protein C0J52_28122 [Blattella germanica]|nr:hypothetical protein C0J52_28122 [Blattella germanica]
MYVSFRPWSKPKRNRNTTMGNWTTAIFPCILIQAQIFCRRLQNNRVVMKPCENELMCTKYGGGAHLVINVTTRITSRQPNSFFTFSRTLSTVDLNSVGSYV